MRYLLKVSIGNTYGTARTVIFSLIPKFLYFLVVRKTYAVFVFSGTSIIAAQDPYGPDPFPSGFHIFIFLTNEVS